MYAHVLSVDTLLGALDPGTVATTLLSATQAIAAADPAAANQCRIGFASGDAPLLEGQSLARRELERRIAEALEKHHPRADVLLATGPREGGVDRPELLWRGCVYFSFVPHISLRTYQSRIDIQRLGGALDGRDGIGLVRDVLGIPIVGTPAYSYLFMKMETRALRSRLVGAFGDRGADGGNVLLQAFDRSEIGRLKMPKKRRELDGFVKRADEILAKEWGDEVLTAKLIFMSLTAREWLKA